MSHSKLHNEIDVKKSRRYTISELAREFDVTPRALRFYEDKDLLHPDRDGMNRVYSVRDRARLKLIVSGKRVGFSLNDIREMLDLYDLGDNQRAQLRASHTKHLEQIKKLEKQRQDIDDAIEELERGITWMEERLAQFGDEDDSSGSARAYDAVARAKLDGEVSSAARR